MFTYKNIIHIVTTLAHVWQRPAWAILLLSIAGEIHPQGQKRRLERDPESTGCSEELHPPTEQRNLDRNNEPNMTCKRYAVCCSILLVLLLLAIIIASPIY